MKKQVKLYFWLVLTVIIGALLGGCAPVFKNILPPDNFLQKENTSIGLIWTSNANLNYPEGPEYTAKHFMLGAQGLLDMAVAHSFSDKLGKALSEIKIKDLMQKHYFNVFQPAFENKNFYVKINTNPYCQKKHNFGTFNEYCTNSLDTTKTSTGSLGYDYKPVIANLNVDYLLVIEISMYGTGRSYYGMLPISPPKGYTVLSSYLIDGKTQDVISQRGSTVVEPVKGEWDDPPQYANLMKAAETSLEIAINEVFIDIFKQAP